MGESFKEGQLVKFRPDVVFAAGTDDWSWANHFRSYSDISCPFVVAKVMMHGGRELIRLKPHDPKRQCKTDWWVPSAAFALHYLDWLEDLPLALTETGGA